VAAPIHIRHLGEQLPVEGREPRAGEISGGDVGADPPLEDGTTAAPHLEAVASAVGSPTSSSTFPHWRWAATKASRSANITTLPP